LGIVVLNSDFEFRASSQMILKNAQNYWFGVLVWCISVSCLILLLYLKEKQRLQREEEERDRVCSIVNPPI